LAVHFTFSSTQLTGSVDMLLRTVRPLNSFHVWGVSRGRQVLGRDP